MKTILISIFVSILFTISSFGNNLVPIYITPYYDSQPLTINVGTYSKKLLTTNKKSLKKLADEIKENIDNVNIETLFVLSLRLYDLKLKDESVYWFYTAQYRAKIYLFMVDYDKEQPKNQETTVQSGNQKFKIKGVFSEPFDIENAVNSFQQLIGGYINGYAFGDIDKLITTLNKVIEDNKEADYFYKEYKNTYFISDDNLINVNNEVSAIFKDFIDEVIKQKDYIKEQRKINKIEGKY